MARELLALRVQAASPVDDAGLSWGGFNLRGDRKSIEEAKRLLHRNDRCTDLEKIVIEQRARVRELERRNAALVAALHLAKEWIAGKHDIGFVEARMDAALAGTSDPIAAARRHALEEAARAVLMPCAELDEGGFHAEAHECAAAAIRALMDKESQK